ncbi:nucleotidyltransferase family protein [Beijerinckia sp. L45]|uniref:nucleotidyltransferase family protein n=1 Tax=Beijerinckia sp. L45 TaxID=1641855 RepID=UPI00131B615B|nr:nucleotidyltransferase domain-containing protein [Beijerinckia sp. L45]
MHPAIREKRDEIVLACRRFNVARLDLFGSGARNDDFDIAASDADFLVAFPPGTAAGAYVDLKETFEQILGRRVDLVDRQAIETSRNYIRRRHILSQAEPFYVA